MRRLFVTAALVTALFGAAACTASPSNTASDTPSSSAASPTPSVQPKDRKTSCADFKTGSEAASVKLLAAMGEAIKIMETPDKAEEIMTKLPTSSFSDIPEMDSAAGDAATSKIEELCK